MITLLSPTKTLDLSDHILVDHSFPRLLTKSYVLIKELRKYDLSGLEKLMTISEKLAYENFHRIKCFKKTHSIVNSRPALFTFIGEVYRGLGSRNFSNEDISFAQDHLRILSGLYGILRPLDLIQPYRLEMGTKLVTDLGKNLYQFWGDNITRILLKDLSYDSNPVIINLASNEYFKSLNKKKIKARIININFKEYRGDTLKFLTFHAKSARGLMARYIIKNRIMNEEDIKGFNIENYGFAEDMSTTDNWLFIR